MSRLVMSANIEGFKLSKLARVYAIWASGGLFLYFISPMVSYLIYWDTLPKISLTIFFSGWLFLTICFRLLLIFSGQLGIRNRYLALGYLLLIWISISQLIWYPTISTQVGLDTFLMTIAFTFVGAWLVFLGGESLAILKLTKYRFVQTTLLIAYLILVLVVVNGVFKSYSLYEKLFYSFQNPASRGIYNYLSLADSLAIVGLLLLGICKADNIWRSLILYVGTSIFLMFAYSRASFFFFLICGSVFMIIRFWPKLKKHLLIALLGLALVIFIMALLWSNQVANKIGFLMDPTIERINSLISGYDLSLQSRLELLKRGFHLLQRHWLLGGFMAEVLWLDRGEYIHNWLSFWISYGIGPFILSVWLLWGLLRRNLPHQNNYSITLANFSILLFTLLSVALARSYIWPYFWFSIGFVATISSSNIRERRL
ncbi:MAG: O-antigen ligase family protein [Thermodesulfobacteriota bacterium]